MCHFFKKYLQSQKNTTGMIIRHYGMYFEADYDLKRRLVKQSFYLSLTKLWKAKCMEIPSGNNERNVCEILEQH